MIALIRRSKKKTIVILLCALTLATVSYAVKSQPRGAIRGVKVADARAQVVLEGPWGKNEGSFGKTEEEARPGPMSFAISRQGIYILDQENNRIQEFNHSGKFIKNIVLSKNTYIDITIYAGKTYLLDAYKTFSVDVYNSEGLLEESLAFEKKQEPVTGFAVSAGKVSIEYGHSTSEVIAEINSGRSTRKTKKQAIKGRPGPGGKPVKASFSGDVSIDIANSALKLEGSDIRYIADIITEGSGLYVLLGTGKETGDSLSEESLVLAKIQNGKTEWQKQLPNSYYTDHFRKVDIYNGSAYQMLTDENGLRLIRWR